MEVTQLHLGIVIALVLVALAFDFMNGFHDAANSIATVVSTGVLKPYQAVLLAAFFNFVALFVFQLHVATTVGKGIVDQGVIDHYVVFGALIGAIAWNVLTWYYGIPSSSSHALIGGIVGAVIAEAGWSAPYWSAIGTKVLLPLIISPLIGFAFALGIMIILLRVFIKRTPGEVQRKFGKWQVASSAFMAFSHGSNDAQKTMGIMTLALASYLGQEDMAIPTWVKLTAAIAMGCGTAMGGWRIIKTMGHKLTKLQP